ncbi:hypothetical protein GQ42DRAFT_160317 [Ramicandelaber brevisporus]|nr:hypothetical protein GQ42DRAFT_160317 [Ramicandelaber brevisporus]
MLSSLPPRGPPGPVIDNIRDGETVHQRVLILFGRVSLAHGVAPGHTPFVSVHSNNGGYPAQSWPINSGYWKALCVLEPGLNTVTVVTEDGSARPYSNISINYTPQLDAPPLRLVIVAAKDSDMTFDAPPDRRGPGQNDLQSAIARLRCAAYLWQAFMSENMYRHGFGRRTFRLEEDVDVDTLSSADAKSGTRRLTAKVHVLRSQFTMEEIRDPHRSQQYSPKDGEQMRENQFDIAGMALDAAKDELGFGEPAYIACLSLDSKWDPEMRLIRGHAALGGGTDERRLAVFGSHTTFTWPASLEGVVPAFTDSTPTDTRYTSNDNGECGVNWKCCNIGMGAFLHEVGHALTLSHTPTGIMSRGFNNFNRTFMIVEPGYAAPVLPANENGAHWHRVDSVRLRFHECLRMPSDTHRRIMLRAETDGSMRSIQCFPASGGRIIMKCHAGIAMVEAWVNDSYKHHVEFPLGQVGVVDPPKQVEINIEEIAATCGASGSCKIKLEITSANQGIHIIEDARAFLRESVVQIAPRNFGQSPISAMKTSKLGSGQMEGSRSYQVVFPNAPLERIVIHHGSYIDGIHFFFADGSDKLCGNRNANVLDFPLFGDERIAYIKVRAGFWIDGFEIFTTSGRSTGWIGSHGGGEHILDVPEGTQLAGFEVSCASWLDSICAIYV